MTTNTINNCIKDNLCIILNICFFFMNATIDVINAVKAPKIPVPALAQTGAAKEQLAATAGATIYYNIELDNSF